MFFQTLRTNLMICTVVVAFFFFITLAVADQLVCTEMKFLFSLKPIGNGVEVGLMTPVGNEIGWQQSAKKKARPIFCMREMLMARTRRLRPRCPWRCLFGVE